MEIADEDAHRMHFHVRDTATGGVRAMDKYLERIDDIRRIQTFLVGCAQREGVEVVQNANVEHAIDSDPRDLSGVCKSREPIRWIEDVRLSPADQLPPDLRRRLAAMNRCT